MTGEEKSTFLGRFQPLHKGHYLVIKDAVERYKDFLIAVGSPRKSRTERNPLNLRERKRLLELCFPEKKKIPVQDEDRGEEGYTEWGKRLVTKTGAEVVITGNQLVKRIVKEETEASVKEPEFYCPERFSGEEIRRKIRSDGDWRCLVPECSREQTVKFESVIRRTGNG